MNGGFIIETVRPYSAKVKNALQDLGYRVEYNIMYKKIDIQGIKLCIDFASHDIGIARVEMPKTFYLDIDRFRKVAKEIEIEVEQLRKRGIIL